MYYLKVAWDHHDPSDPVTLYSECDEGGWERRKVEMFADGRLGYAGPQESRHGSALGQEPIPSLQDIAADPQFRPVLVSREEFEMVWGHARATTQA